MKKIAFDRDYYVPAGLDCTAFFHSSLHTLIYARDVLRGISVKQR